MTLREAMLLRCRGLLTMPAIFSSCFMLLLAPLAGTVEGATVTAQVPVDQRTYPAVSGITITQGQSLTITATGTACYDTDCNPPVSPDGSGRGLGEPNFKLPGAPQHGLVCGIGGQSPSDLFFVGSSFSGQADRSGSLFCGMNEADIPDSWPDNSGRWTVTVTTDARSWSGWSAVSGGGQTGSQPAAVVDSTGTLHLYIQGIDNGLWVKRKSGGIWSDWSRVASGNSLDGPAAFLDGNAVRLVVRGLDNSLWTALPDDSSVVWEPLGGETMNAPAAVLEGSTLHIFVRGIDGQLYMNSRAGGSGDSDNEPREE